MELRASCRTAALTIFLGAGLMTSAQEPSINLTIPAMGLGKAVEQISKQAGKKMTVSPALEREPVVLRVSDLPLQEVMDKICYEFVAEWVPTRDGIELTRTDKVLEEFEKQLAARRLAGYQESMKELQKLASSEPMDDAEAKRIAVAYAKMLTDEKNGTNVGDGIAKRQSFSNRTADMRMLAKLVLAVGAEKLSSLPYGRHVFSLNPTAMQLPIENVDPQLLEEYVQQRNLLAKEIAASVTQELHDGYGDSAMFSANQIAKKPVKALLQIHSDPRTVGTWIYLHVYDSTGASISSSNFALGDTYNPAQFMAQRGKAAAASKDEAEVSLPDDVKELVERYNNRQGTGKALSAKAIERLTQPEKIEPFTMCFSDILLAQAEREGRNLSASTADADLRIARSLATGSVKPATYEATMTGFKQVAYERPDGWLIVRSKNPVAATDSRLDRAALGAFTRAWIAKGYCSIEDWSELAIHVAPDDHAALAMMYWNLLRNERAMNYSNDWETLRIYGMMSQSDVDQLTSGSSLPYYTLPPEAKAAIEKMVYVNMAIRGLPGYRPRNQSQVATDSDGAVFLQGIEGEPTESVPGGVPGNTSMKARVTQKQTLFVKEGGMGGFPFEREMQIGELAGLLVQLQDGPPIAPDYKIVGIRIGTKKVITFELPLSDKVQMLSQLREDHFETPEPITVDQLKERLPSAVWDELQKKMAEVREMRKKYGNNRLFPAEAPTTTPPPASS